MPIQAASAESRRACVAAAHFVADPFDEARPATDAVAYGAVMPGIDITLKSLKDPYLFRLADGRFALAATRTARGGAPDGSERSAFLLALSDDLTAFTQLGLVMLRKLWYRRNPAILATFRAIAIFPMPFLET